MATTSQTASTLREYYKWSNANFTWNALQCNGQINSFGIYDHTLNSTETVSSSDSRKGSTVRHLHELVSVSDKSEKDLMKSFEESVSASETYWDNIGFMMNFLENLQIDENASNSTGKISQDSFLIADEACSSVFQQVNELLVVTDLLLRQFSVYRQYDEDMSIAEVFSQTPGKISKEIFSIAEYFFRNLLHSSSEHVDIADLCTHMAAIKRTVSEAIGALDGYNGNYRDNQSEELQIRDTFLRACQGVLADIGIYRGGITLEEFMNVVKTPSGYEPFIPYVVGEYEYEKALVRLLIKAGSMGSQPAVYDAVINVDIDDTVDRGTLNITSTNAPTKVYFNKHYYTKPEVAVTLQAGNTANGIITPNIVDIDSDDNGYFFTVELLRSDGTRTQGRITWNSVGY